MLSSSCTKMFRLWSFLGSRRLPYPPYAATFFQILPLSSHLNSCQWRDSSLPLPLPRSCFPSPDECQVLWASSPEGWGLWLRSTPETEWSQQRWVILNCVVTSLFFLPFCSQRIAGEVCCAKGLECGFSPLLPPSKQKERTLCCEMC